MLRASKRLSWDSNPGFPSSSSHTHSVIHPDSSRSSLPKPLRWVSLPPFAQGHPCRKGKHLNTSASDSKSWAWLPPLRGLVSWARYVVPTEIIPKASKKEYPHFFMGTLVYPLSVGENSVFVKADVTSVLPFLFGKAVYVCMYVCKNTLD